ncbi:MAG: hypothetical protein E7345_03860 [Clostridiales bacterium]|nr:hypothetical protein [Clostridiales bacterium]
MAGTIKNAKFVEMIKDKDIVANNIIYYSTDSSADTEFLGSNKIEVRTKLKDDFRSLQYSMERDYIRYAGIPKIINKVCSLLEKDMVDDESLTKLKTLYRKMKARRYTSKLVGIPVAVMGELGVIKDSDSARGFDKIKEELENLCEQIELSSENLKNKANSRMYFGLNDEIVKIIDVIKIFGYNMVYDAKSQSFTFVSEINSAEASALPFALLKSGVLRGEHLNRFVNGYLNKSTSRGESVEITAESLFNTILAMAKESGNDVSAFEGKSFSEILSNPRQYRVKVALSQLCEIEGKISSDKEFVEEYVLNSIKQLEGVISEGQIKDFLVEFVNTKKLSTSSVVTLAIEKGIQKFDPTFKFETPTVESEAEGVPVMERDERYGVINAGVDPTIEEDEFSSVFNLEMWGAYNRLYANLKDLGIEVAKEKIEELKSSSDPFLTDELFDSLLKQLEDPTYNDEHLIKLRTDALREAKIHRFCKDNEKDPRTLTEDELRDAELISIDGDLNEFISKELEEVNVEMSKSEAVLSNDGKIPDAYEIDAKHDVLTTEGKSDIEFPQGAIYRLGYFEDLFEIFSKKVEGLSDDEKTTAIKTHIDKYRGQSEKTKSSNYNQFFEALEDSVLAGKKEGSSTNKYYSKLKEDAVKELKVIKAEELLIKEVEEARKVLVKVSNNEDVPEQKVIDAQELIDKFNSVNKDKLQRQMLAWERHKDNAEVENVNDADLKKSYSQQKTDKYIKLGDKKEFDVKGYQKKMKPFNAKAGIKYLEELEKAIKNIQIMQQGKESKVESKEEIIEGADRTAKELLADIVEIANDVINSTNIQGELAKLDKDEDKKLLVKKTCEMAYKKLASAIKLRKLLETRPNADEHKLSADQKIEEAKNTIETLMDRHKVNFNDLSLGDETKNLFMMAPHSATPHVAPRADEAASHAASGSSLLSPADLAKEIMSEASEAGAAATAVELAAKSGDIDRAKENFAEASRKIASAIAKNSRLQAMPDVDGTTKANANQTIEKAGVDIRRAHEVLVRMGVADIKPIAEVLGETPSPRLDGASASTPPKPETSTPVGGDAHATSERVKGSELMEKAAFYRMGQILAAKAESFYNSIKITGIDSLSEEDRAKVLRDKETAYEEIKLYQKVFNLLAFGKDESSFDTIVDGKTIRCNKIGYLQQVLYAKMSNPSFDITGDEISKNLRISPPFDETSISLIVKVFTSIDHSLAVGLVGMISTKDAKGELHYGGQFKPELIKSLEGKDPKEMMAILDNDYASKKAFTGTLVNSDELDLYVAEEDGKFLKRLADEISKSDSLKDCTGVNYEEKFNLIIESNKYGMALFDRYKGRAGREQAIENAKKQLKNMVWQELEKSNVME